MALIDFWDYSCVNCLRTIPYVKEWHERYAYLGLVVIGVHAPEFEFARSEANVERAVAELGIEYPVVMDNDYATWHAFTNRYWPAKYLVDAGGYIRYWHFGEGNYADTEEAIQLLLGEAGLAEALPPVMDPIRASDEIGAVCEKPSPEIYMGHLRGKPGNPEGYQHGQGLDYSMPAALQDDVPALAGRWRPEAEFVVFEGPGEGRVSLSCAGAEINAVLESRASGPCVVEALKDGRPVPPEDRGEDLVEDLGRTWLRVSRPRMYRILSNARFGRHDVTLVTRDPGLAVYAWTFVSCVKE